MGDVRIEVEEALSGQTTGVAPGPADYASGQTLKAIAFNSDTQQARGEPVSLPDVEIGRFLMMKPATEGSAGLIDISVVLNWTEELKRLVPTR